MNSAHVGLHAEQHGHEASVLGPRERIVDGGNSREQSKQADPTESSTQAQ